MKNFAVHFLCPASRSLGNSIWDHQTPGGASEKGSQRDCGFYQVLVDLNNISISLLIFYKNVLWGVSSVLVSGGIVLTFFLVVHIILFFGFRMTIMLIAHWCFSCYWAVLTLLFSFSHFWKELKGDRTRTTDANWPKVCLKTKAITWNSVNEGVGQGAYFY